jgi:hypothetical protein
VGTTETMSDPRGREELFSNAYVRRVYRTALAVWAVVGLMLLVNRGLPAVLGWSFGAAVSLGSLRLLELTVLLLVHPSLNLSPGRIAMLLNLKLPLLTVLLAGLVWAAMEGKISIFALAAGLTLAPAVITLKAVGAWLLTVTPATETRVPRRTTGAALPRSLDPRQGKISPALRELASGAWRLTSGD